MHGMTNTKKYLFCTYIYSTTFNLKQYLSLKHYLHQSCNKDACCRKINRPSCFYIDPLQTWKEKKIQISLVTKQRLGSQ